MKTRLTWAVVRAGAVLAFLTAGGCDGSGAPIPYSQLESSAESAVCHYEVVCNAYPDMATCLASEQASPHFFDTLGADISSGKVLYNGAQARVCIDALNGISSCNRSALANFDPECGNVSIFTGTVPAGGPCFFKEECAGGGTCQKTDSSCTSDQCCPGTCSAAPAPVPVGGDCSASGASCITGSNCVYDNSTSPATFTCQTPGGVGASCVSISSCKNPLYCDTKSGTCKSPVATGGACDPSLGSEGCDSGNDRCDTTTMVCTPRLGLRSACDPTNSGCVSYAVCDATTSTCVDRPTVGQSCDPTNGPSCLGGDCDATSLTCALRPTAGVCS
jgi:hypothetical protein